MVIGVRGSGRGGTPWHKKSVLTDYDKGKYAEYQRVFFDHGTPTLFVPDCVDMKKLYRLLFKDVDRVTCHMKMITHLRVDGTFVVLTLDHLDVIKAIVKKRYMVKIGDVHFYPLCPPYPSCSSGELQLYRITCDLVDGKLVVSSGDVALLTETDVRLIGDDGKFRVKRVDDSGLTHACHYDMVMEGDKAVGSFVDGCGSKVGTLTEDHVKLCQKMRIKIDHRVHKTPGLNFLITATETVDGQDYSGYDSDPGDITPVTRS